MTDQLDHRTDDLATALIAGDQPAAERALDALRELVWCRRADVVRARRHAGPRVRGRATVRRKPRTRATLAGEASDLIAAGRRGV